MEGGPRPFKGPGRHLEIPILSSDEVPGAWRFGDAKNRLQKSEVVL